MSCSSSLRLDQDDIQTYHGEYIQEIVENIIRHMFKKCGHICETEMRNRIHTRSVHIKCGMSSSIHCLDVSETKGYKGLEGLAS